MRNFKGDSNFLWGLVSLRHLERLDLFRSVSEPDVLCSILKNNPNLKHLNLGMIYKLILIYLLYILL